MPKKPITVNRVAGDALATLAAQIRLARHAKGWTAADLAARIGVSANTVSAIESAQPGVAVGSVLNAAAVTGVRLFGPDPADLARMRRRGEESVALIPSRTFRPRGESERDDVDIDF